MLRRSQRRRTALRTLAVLVHHLRIAGHLLPSQRASAAAMTSSTSIQPGLIGTTQITTPYRRPVRTKRNGDCISYLNMRRACAAQQAGSHRASMSGPMVVKLRHSNRFVTIEVPGRKVGSLDHRSVPLGEYWLGHRDRAQYRGVTFRPKGERVVDECLNIWQGWGLVPKAGD